MTGNDATTPVKSDQDSPRTEPGTEQSSMASTHAMTPITGTNGYQQHVSIDPDQPLSLSVSNTSGEIRVTGSEKEGVWVVVRRSDGIAEHDPEVIPVTVNVDGNYISVHPDWGVAGGLTGLARKIKDQLQHGLNPNDWDLSQIRLHPDLNYDIRVEVPRKLVTGSRITAKTASGRLAVREVNADLVVATASGKITLNQIRGTVTSNSASGSSSIEQVYGSLEVNSASGSVSVAGGEAWTALRTVSGGIRIDRFTMKNARLATVSGSIKAVVTADNAQEYAISTVSGSVNLDLTVPAAAGTKMSSRSASGSAKVSGDWVADGRRSWRMGTAETGPVFNVRTMSGSLTSVGKTDASLNLSHEPLPVSRMDDSDQDDVEFTRDLDDVESTGEGGRHPAGGSNLDMNFDNMTTWAKDFASDFKKNFSGLGTPPTPPTPPNQPSAPTAPDAPAPPAPPRPSDDQATTGTIPGQPWTWSTGSGSTPPTGEQQTAPIEALPGEDAPSAAQTLANTDTDAERLRVLEALERGDIDIDEALARLDNDDAQGA